MLALWWVLAEVACRMRAKLRVSPDAELASVVVDALKVTQRHLLPRMHHALSAAILLFHRCCSRRNVHVYHLTIQVVTVAQILARCSLDEGGSVDMRPCIPLRVVNGRCRLLLYIGQGGSDLLLVHHVWRGDGSALK